MFCQKCGKAINNNASFCQYCGTKVEYQFNYIDNQNAEIENNESSKVNRFSIGVFFSFIFILFTIMLFSEKHFLSGFLAFLISILLFPKTNNLLKNKYSEFGLENYDTFKNIIVFVLFIFFFGTFSDNSNTNNSSSNSQELKSTKKVETYQTQSVQTQQNTLNNQEEIKKIETCIKEFQKAGIFIKIKDMGNEGGYKLLEIQIDEYAWNNLDYDTKKAVDNMFLEYWQIANVTVLFRGYRTGQKLYSKDKNFKI